ESSRDAAIDPPVTGGPRVSPRGHSAVSPRRRLMAQKLSGVVADHIRAINAFDTDAIMATFAKDAYVNDAQREIVGRDAIRRWVEKEMVGAHVTIEVREVVDHYGDVIVRGL